MRWVKALVDRSIAEHFGWPDLEFAWKQDRDIDPLTQAQINQIYLAAGVLSPGEVRAEIGKGDAKRQAGGVVAKYSADQPRDQQGRWTDGGGEALTISAPLSPEGGSQTSEAQAVPGVRLACLEDACIAEGAAAATILEAIIGRGIGAAVAGKLNARKDTPECRAEWEEAELFCEERRRRGQMGGSSKGLGRFYDECLRGQVSEECGGNRVK